jgi:hypothetical protein
MVLNVMNSHEFYEGVRAGKYLFYNQKQNLLFFLLKLSSG